MTRKLTIRRLLVALALLVLADLTEAQDKEPPRIMAVEPERAITTPGAKLTVIGAHLSPDTIVYFGGIQVREMTFVNSAALQVVTSYLRPGSYKLDLKSGEAIFHSDVTFTALPAAVDSTIEQADRLTSKDQTNSAIGIFNNIAATHPDYDVRAYAHYRAAQLYLMQGDYWRAAEAAALWDPKVSMGVQSSWRYRLLSDELTYAISRSDKHDTDLTVADWTVKWDITENSEPRFWRALMYARFGKINQAKVDLKFALAAEPENPSYRALAAYIGALAGDKAQLEAFRGVQVSDTRALRLLGQAAYISGDDDAAQAWWKAQTKSDVVWAKLACLAGEKHVQYGQTRVGAALLAECTTVAPDSREGREAKKLLTDLANHPR